MANDEKALDDRTHFPLSEATQIAPPSPGGTTSSKLPGMRPDRSTVPGHFSTRLSRPKSVRRPLTQYGTAEEIMSVFRRKPESQMISTDFEQAPASLEEMRKAIAADVPPTRPMPPALPSAPAPAALTEGDR